MENHKLILLFQQLSKKELQGFESFVASPFFNTNTTLISLLAILQKHHPKFASNQFSREKIWQKINPNKAYNKQQLSNWLTKLGQLFEQYLIHSELKVQAFQQDQLLLDGLRRKRLFDSYESSLKKIKKRYSHHAQQVEIYYQQYSLELQEYAYHVQNRGRVPDSNLPDLIQQLDYFYLSNKLRFLCTMHNHRNIYTDQTAILFEEEMLAFIEEYPLENQPLILLWYRLLLMLREEGEEGHFQEMKQLLQHQADAISKSELKQLFTAVFNYCNRRIREGKAHYWEELFDIYQELLRTEVLLIDGFISPSSHYNNIVKVAIRLGKLDWAEAFIQEYQHKMHPERRHAWYHYALAILYFARADYSATIEHLLQFDFKDYAGYMLHKILLAQAYYELGEDEALQALLHSFRMYLSRAEQIPEHILLSNQNFVKVLGKLLRRRMGGKVDFGELEGMRYLREREWLAGKVIVN